MKAVAIICEYNPFHTGHAYHIAAAKQACDADTVIGIMSGCFVQRAEPAVVSPVVRAKAALYGGMDFVVELPVVFSCSAGSLFAEGGATIAGKIPAVKYLAMGTEDGGTALKAIAAVQAAEPPVYADTLHRCIGQGLPYAAAVTQATVAAMNGILSARACESILKKPNNVLAIEYLKAITRHKLDITPVFIPRTGNGYNDDSTTGEYISATAARNLLASKDYATLGRYIPRNGLDELIVERENFAMKTEIYEALTVHALRTHTADDMAPCDAAEGIDGKLHKAALRYASLSDVLNACKSKRYTMSRLKRICLQTLLGITQESAKQAAFAKGRLIGYRAERKNDVKHLCGVAVRNSDYAENEKTAALAQTDGKAGGIYSLITGRDGNLFWQRKPVTV